MVAYDLDARNQSSRVAAQLRLVRPFTHAFLHRRPPFTCQTAELLPHTLLLDYLAYFYPGHFTSPASLNYYETLFTTLARVA